MPPGAPLAVKVVKEPEHTVVDGVVITGENAAPYAVTVAVTVWLVVEKQLGKPTIHVYVPAAKLLTL